jgi:hypothetical protein
MNRNKLIAIIGGVIVLVLFVLFFAFRYTPKNNLNGPMSVGDSFDVNSTESLTPAPMRAQALPGSGGGTMGKMASDSGVMMQDNQEVFATEGADKKVIKNGNLTLKVDKVDGVIGEIEKIAKDNGGDLFSSNFFQNSQAQKSGTLSVKVPVANFEKTFSELKKVGNVVVRESTSGQDVTREYQDLESQIKNKQAEEQAYQKILAQAQKVSDILEVTGALSRARGEIESLQGTLRYLAAQTDLATITLNLSEDTNITLSDSWRPLQVAKNAVRSLLVKVQNFVDFIIIFLITFIPTFLLYLLLAWVVYRIGKAIFLKMHKKEE